jgi:hypothetical protein
MSMHLADDSTRKTRTMTRQCVIMPDELYERAHAAAAALGMRFSHLATAGLEQVVRSLEEAHGPFTPRAKKMPIGRPTTDERRAVASLIPP